ncbi:uncharacterized protein LOC123697058 [Colias croceus]|uniref:uncharacterized protein LOC123697058 n=1 Tax=Colias crocea TaxID=72248 RepID=UPI001E27EE0B|nr:uncharacterized protein LOC123697058 [Colias croceus]
MCDKGSSFFSNLPANSFTCQNYLNSLYCLSYQRCQQKNKYIFKTSCDERRNLPLPRAKNSNENEILQCLNELEYESEAEEDPFEYNKTDDEYMPDGREESSSSSSSSEDEQPLIEDDNDDSPFCEDQVAAEHEFVYVGHVIVVVEEIL